MQRSMFAAAIALLAIGSAMIDTPAYAVEPTAEQREAIQVKIEELRARLALTPEQEEKIAPLVRERNEKLQALRGKSDPNASRSEKRALLQETRGIQDDFVARVEPLLTKEQIKEWEAIRQEARKEIAERWRSR